MNSQNNGLPRQ